MPIYEYRRPDGSTFEVIQSFSDEPLTHDPDTGVEVRRVLHAPAVHFKGSGFYNTDYGTRRRQRESANESADGDASGGGSKDSKDGGSSKDGSSGKDAATKSDGSGSASPKSSDSSGSSAPKSSGKSEKVSAS